MHHIERRIKDANAKKDVFVKQKLDASEKYKEKLNKYKNDKEQMVKD